jgi:MFS family permease
MAKEDSRGIIYLLVFLYTLHATPAIYINSSFLEQMVGKSSVGYIFAISSFFTLISFVFVRRALRKFGNFKFFISILGINTIGLALMSTSLIVDINKYWTALYVIAFVIIEIMRNASFLSIDIFLEHFTSNKNTGGVRGFFLTSLNLAFVFGPMVASFLISGSANLGIVYVWGFILSVLVMIMAYFFFKKFEDPHYEKSDLIHTLGFVLLNKNLRKIFSANLILRFFFSWMVIYTPIFMHDVIGFSYSDIGIIIGIGLIPFVLLEIPLGKIADSKLGEKEILTAGFLIASAATLIIIFLPSPILWVWAVVLFMTRVGAAMIEVMTETYLFKKIDADDINVMGLYRAVRPFAYVISPIIASIMLVFFSMHSLFIFLSIILLTGIYYSLTLKDTL